MRAQTGIRISFRGYMHVFKTTSKMNDGRWLTEGLGGQHLTCHVGGTVREQSAITEEKRIESLKDTGLFFSFVQDDALEKSIQ